jgi:ABC-2 type transport system ATP-binding protein
MVSSSCGTEAVSGEEPAIRARGLVKCFGDLKAVDGLSVEVERGELFGLVGPDGAGKTTTLRMLSGIMDPTSGEAWIAGYSTKGDARKVKDQIAYMAQRFGLYLDLTVQENIDFYAELYGAPRRGRRERVDQLLDFSQMRPFKKRLAGQLSGGMKQKLQLVCALIHTPKVLLLDEPTSGVDPLSRRDFWRMLYELLKQGVTVFVTTAYLDEAERCNRVGLLNHGRLLALGAPAELRDMVEGRILVIHSAYARAVRRVLRDWLDGGHVNVFGDSVHVRCEDVDQVQDRVRKLLEEKGLDYDDMSERKASLEDVFVSLLGDGGGREETLAPRDAPGEDAAVVIDRGDKNGVAMEVQGLTRRFGDFVAVKGLTFKVPSGQIFGFLGPNGAGKSTTIRMLCGLLAPSEGRGTVAGFDLVRQPEAIKQRIGYMSQRFSLYEDLTVGENIDFYGGIYGLSGRRLAERKKWAVAMAGLEGRVNSSTALLSGGWKQRLALACAILHEPPIVFLDEPTSGTDPLSRRHFWDLIYSMADRGVTIFVTTHYMEEAEYCDRIGLIYRGELIAVGAPRELKTQMMRQKILSVQCPDAHDMMDAVEELDEVGAVALFGAALHVEVEDAGRAEQAIRRLFERKKHELEGVEEILPTMEDVFVSLIEAADRKDAG